MLEDIIPVGIIAGDLCSFACQVELLYDELARILKTYLGGRYRIDLLERTTLEAVPELREAGTPDRAIAAVRQVLEECDLVKFAGRRPEVSAWRPVVEKVYEIVVPEENMM